ncbi:MAG: hypothetical protein DMF62_12340 [Acidobacteria bacterium]|nr:MAG: hypothetical protein DMF62_12340 [Acidobacteriota bacterium]
MLRTLILIIASISFIIMIGGATYEHTSVVPIWASAPPASLSMFQGNYPLSAWNFWIPIHPINVILLLTSLIVNWGTARRKFILMTIGGYFLVLVVTFIYFVPELMSIIQSSYSTVIDPELTRRAKNWELFSLVRLGVIMVLAVSLLFGLAKSNDPKLA